MVGFGSILNKKSTKPNQSLILNINQLVLFLKANQTEPNRTKSNLVRFSRFSVSSYGLFPNQKELTRHWQFLKTLSQINKGDNRSSQEKLTSSIIKKIIMI